MNREYSRDQTIKGLTNADLTQDKAEHFLGSSESERLKILDVVQERAIADKEATSWRPMPLAKGPPLPRRLGIKWPWIMWRELGEKCDKEIEKFAAEITKGIHSPWG